MARRLLWLAVPLILLGAAVRTAGTGLVASRHASPGAGVVVASRPPDTGAGLVARTVVFARGPTRTLGTPLGATLQRRLTLLTRGMRPPRARARRRIVHARSITAPPALAAPSVCPVAGRGCSLHPCVLFAGGGAVVLRLTTATLVGSLPGRGHHRETRRTAMAIAPFAPRAGGRRGLRAAGCRHLRARALSIS